MIMAPIAWRILNSTLNVSSPQSKISKLEGPLIFACLHRDIVGAIAYVQPFKPHLLVSESDDGLILVRTLGSAFNYVRGATGENGGRALVKLRNVLNQGMHIGLAVDGPKGPFGTVHPGVFQLASLTGATVVPLLPIIRPRLVLNTWDQTHVPYFFSKIEMKVGPFLKVANNVSKEDVLMFQRELSDFLGGQSEDC